MSSKNSLPNSSKNISLAITVSALGYFVDVYDIVLFMAVRVQSLQDLGLNAEEVRNQGVFLLNCQLIGMLLGGFLWGILGDKKGRLQVLFGSIFVYSVANLLNAMVTDTWWYAVCRFIAGIGLAGEMGAGITLVSELMHKESRGWGATIVATVGVSGSTLAGIVSTLFDWRTAYVIGGVLGLVLLFLRVSVKESSMFATVKQDSSALLGDITLFFNNKRRFLTLLACTSIGLFSWVSTGMVRPFSPEIGVDLGITEPIMMSTIMIISGVTMSLGDFASGAGSQIIKSRKRITYIFLTVGFLSTIALLSLNGISPTLYYAVFALTSFCGGYWAVFITTSAELFGTNIRSTAASIIPNLTRGGAVLITTSFDWLIPTFGVTGSAKIVTTVFFLISMAGAWYIRETYGKDLNFIETKDGST